MDVETINLDGRVAYQVSWQGVRAKSYDKEKAVSLLKAVIRLKEAWGITKQSHA